MSDALSTDGPATSGLGVPGRRIDDVPGLQAEGRDVLRGAGGEPVAGSGDDEGVLARAATIRFPELSDKQGRERIDALIDHINATAIARGELEELRLQAHVNLRAAEAQLARVPSASFKSNAAIAESKRQARPDLAEQIDGARWLVERCTEQINRMGGSEYDAASRTYTLLSGT